MNTDKSTDKNSDGKSGEAFLSRWARVKGATQAATQEAAPAPAAQPASSPSIDIAGQNTSMNAPLQAKMAEDGRPERTLPEAPSALPALDSLTPQSDYSPFMARDVDPQLRNRAMKKLFTDPHYNVMDRLDTYIDDYSTHPPLPLEVIRQMSIAKSMRLFDDEEVDGAVAAAETALPVPKPVAAPTLGDAGVAVDDAIVPGASATPLPLATPIAVAGVDSGEKLADC